MTEELSRKGQWEAQAPTVSHHPASELLGWEHEPSGS